MIRRKQSKNKGSISLEYVLFVSAATVLAVGIFAFYNNISDFFSGVTIPASDLSGNSNINGTGG